VVLDWESGPIGPQPICGILIVMNYEIDKVAPEDEGDGLPNMRWRLRAIIAASLAGLAALAAIISLIR
jgi:hypothetical protein